jgi:hypothetical protein
MRTPKTPAEKREKAWQEWQLNRHELEAPLPIHIYQKGCYVWYKYPYPYCRSKVVERSTKLRVKPSTFLPIGESRVPNLREFKHLLWIEDEGRFIDSLRAETGCSGSLKEGFNALTGEWASQFKFFEVVERPRALLEKLLDLEGDHYMRLFEDTRKAIAQGRELKLIGRMKTRLLKYAPSLYHILDDEQRASMGKKHIPMLMDILKIEGFEKRSARKR